MPKRKYKESEIPNCSLWARVTSSEREQIKIQCARRQTTAQETVRALIRAWLADPDAMERAAGKALREES